MIGRSLPEYVFIRLCILGLRLIAPASIVYLLFSWYDGHFLVDDYLGYYAVAEAVFYLCIFLPRSRHLQQAATHPPLPSREQREELFAKCFARVRDQQIATGWFFHSLPENIKRENMAEWLLWALFGSHLDGLQEEWKEELETYLSRMEQLIGCKFSVGREEAVKCMKNTLDPVDAVHRPLLWYAIVAFIDTVTGTQMLLSGFRHYASWKWMLCFPPRTLAAFSNPTPHPELVYWLRPHRSTTKDPILFLHGIGIGLWPYVPFFHDVIASDPDVGIIALENLSISMRISPPPPSRPTMLAAISALLDAHSISRVVVVSHSYGTVTAAHMLRDPVLSARVSAWLFVDPIPFLLHLPAVAYNFVYREPRAANEWQLWYFASRDPDIARALARHFFWSENILWKEDLAGRDVAVVLSGQDQIVDAKEVWQYLTDADTPVPRWKDGQLEVLYYPDLDHAQVFDSKKCRRPLVDVLRDFSTRQ